MNRKNVNLLIILMSASFLNIKAADEKRERVLNTRLFIGLMSAREDLVEQALADGTNPDASYLVYAVWEEEETCERSPFIHIACDEMTKHRLPEETVEHFENQKGLRKQIFYRLLKECQNLDATDAEGHTILTKIAQENHCEQLQELGEKGYLKKMNLNFTTPVKSFNTPANMTALSIAWHKKTRGIRMTDEEQDKCDKIIDILLHAGADYRIGGPFTITSSMHIDEYQNVLHACLIKGERRFLQKILRVNLLRDTKQSIPKNRENSEILQEFGRLHGNSQISSAQTRGGQVVTGMMSDIVRIGMANPYTVSPHLFENRVLRLQLGNERIWWQDEKSRRYSNSIRARLQSPDLDYPRHQRSLADPYCSELRSLATKIMPS